MSITNLKIPPAPGIYQITCQATGRIYVGSSQNLRQRKYEHWYKLRQDKHRNPPLQDAWNEFGEAQFVFSVLEIAADPDEDGLREREQHFIDTLNACDPDVGFNVSFLSDSRAGVKQ